MAVSLVQILRASIWTQLLFTVHTSISRSTHALISHAMAVTMAIVWAGVHVVGCIEAFCHTRWKKGDKDKIR